MRIPDFSGGGAMLARLVDLGARAGLTATQTLLHVLDGAPLEMPPAPVVVRAAPKRDAHVPNYPNGPLIFGSDVESQEETRAAEPIAADGSSYGLSAAEPDPVAAVADGSEAALAKPGALREFIDLLETDLSAKAANAEPLRRRTQLRHTRRGRGVEGRSKTQAAIELYGTTELSIAAIAEQIGSTPGAVTAYVKVAVRDRNPLALAGDAARGRVRQTRRSRALPEPSMAVAPALTSGTDGAGGRVEVEIKDWQAPDEAPMAVDGDGEEVATAPLSEPIDSPPAGFDGEGGHADPGPDDSPKRVTECAERDAGPSDPDGDVAAFPAPQVASTAPEMGTVRQDQPTLDAPAEPDTAGRPAGPGPVSGDAAPVSPVAERILDLFGKTTLRQSEIASQIGKTQNHVSGCISAARAKGDQRVIDGDTARRAVATMAGIARSVAAPAMPATPAVTQAPPVLIVSGNRIEGPSGGLDGFPLVSRILAALADGLERHCDDVALVAEARSGAAVMAVLGQWAKDLASIGVAVVIGNDGCILLRKAVP